MNQGKRSVAEGNSMQQFKRGRYSMSSCHPPPFHPPPTPLAPHYAFRPPFFPPPTPLAPHYAFRPPFFPPPTPLAPHYTFMNSNVTFNPLARPTTSRETSIVSSQGSNKPSTVPINIKICDMEQKDHISFRIMRGTPLKKAMVAFCEQQNKEFASIRFTVDGRRCRGDLTPDEMGMEDGDEIDAWLDADGGSYVKSPLS